MTDLFDALCTILEDELERQETVLAVCRAQQAALANRDIEYLEAKTAALELLIEEAADAERDRQRVLGLLFNELGLPEEGRTLSALSAVAPAPYSTQLTELQARLQDVLAASQGLVAENDHLFRASARTVDRCLDTVQALRGGGQASAYGERGRGAHSRVQPALLDQKG